MKIFKLLTSQKEQNMKFLMGSEGRKGLLQALSGLLGTFSGLSLAFSGSVKAREGKDKAPGHILLLFLTFRTREKLLPVLSGFQGT